MITVKRYVSVQVNEEQLEKVNKGRRKQGNQIITADEHVEQLIAGALNAPICEDVTIIEPLPRV